MYMDKVDYEDLKTTRDYLQDISKIIGKVQQLFLPFSPNDWQRGLEVNENGISSQDLDDGLRIILDLSELQLIIGKHCQKLDGLSVKEVLKHVQDWLNSTDKTEKIPEIEFTSESKSIDIKQAQIIKKLLYLAEKSLVELEKSTKSEKFSPILLYPHHFDLSITRPVNKDDAISYTYGFSIGDENIAEPYFYVTKYPEDNNFTGITLPKPSYWQTKGFRGAILKYNDIVSDDDYFKLICDYFKVTID